MLLVNVKEICAKSILSKSKVFDYSINPYIGCEYGCTYCYARFIKRFTGHLEAWGTFVDVKINAPTLLLKGIKKKKKGNVWISGVCDPYQPLERSYQLTRKCLQILLRDNWPVTIQTKSPLIVRDIELIKNFSMMTVGFTITTADENMRKIFEPNAPPIKHRIETLKNLHSAGVKTFAMIAPILPAAEDLVLQLKGKVDYVVIDRMNYNHARQIFRKHNLEYAMTKTFFDHKKVVLSELFKKEQIPCQLLF